MKQAERISLLRIFTDLILADSIIDSREMGLFAELKQRYAFTKEDEMQSAKCTLSDAVECLRQSESDIRKQLLTVFMDVALSDAYCAKQEALLIIALDYCLGNTHNRDSSVISIRVQDINLENSQVLYVESEYDEEINRSIIRNYRNIYQEFKMAMFDFVYIPVIASHYNETPVVLLRQIISFVSPQYGSDYVAIMAEKLSNVTTVEFCKDQLCNKLGMRALYDTSPALLVKIGDSYIDNATYANYLKIDITKDAAEMVKEFVDRFMSMQCMDSFVVSNKRDMAGRFLYMGFYKQLFDIFMLQREVKSSILIDTMKEQIGLPELDVVLNQLHRKEKAYYLLFLIEMKNGGINFSQPQTSRQMERYNKRMELLQRKYNIVYKAFGGEEYKVPDISNEKIRLPMNARIKRAFMELKCQLHNAEDYTIQRNDLGVYTLHVDLKKVFFFDYQRQRKIPLIDTEIFCRVHKM
jgi:hypothetical protein